MRILCLAFTAVFLIGGQQCFAQTISIPPEVKTDRTPRTEQGEPDCVIVASPLLKAYVSRHNTAEPVPGGDLRFGSLYWVMSRATRPVARWLLAEYEKDEFGARKFAKFVGWVEPDWLVTGSRCMTVSEARAKLKSAIKTPRLRRKIDHMLPEMNNEVVKRTSLKAVTHPEFGSHCFRSARDATDENRAKAANDDTRSTPLKPFAFYYVYDLVVRPDASNKEWGHVVFCLLARTDDVNPFSRGNYAEDILGWIRLDHIRLWCSREAFEYNLTEAARSHRKSQRDPIRLFARESDLEDWVDGARGSDKVAFQEDFDAEWLQQAWPADWMRYPVLRRLEGLPEEEAFEICVWGAIEGSKIMVSKNLNPDQAPITDAKRKMSTVVDAMRVVELVLVVDVTFSMDPVIRATRAAIKSVTKAMVREEAARKESGKTDYIQLRVAFVGYRDFGDAFVTKPSTRFYEATEIDAMAAEMDKVLIAGGGHDDPEQPFEGLRTAKDVFFSKKSHHHNRGAIRCVLLLGDHGNHTGKSRGRDPLSLEEVLGFCGEISGSSLAEVTVNAVKTHSNYSSLFKSQMGEIARRTGGTFASLDLSNYFSLSDAGRAAIHAKLAGMIRESIDKQRAIVGQKMISLDKQLANVADVKSPITMLTEKSAREVLGDDYESVMGTLNRTFFVNMFCRARTPKDPKDHPRLRLKILFTEDELEIMKVTFNRLAKRIDRKLDRGKDYTDKELKEVLIRSFLATMGEDDDRYDELKDDGWPALDDQFNQLPIRFGLLDKAIEGGTLNMRAVGDIVETLRSRADIINAILKRTKEDRLFSAGLQQHLHSWVAPEELP